MSMLPFSCDRNIPPQLRLWTPSDDDSRGISPAMTLSEFFTAWFLPVVLVGQQAAREGTLTLYRDAVRWWAQLTGDPPIAQIDVLLLAQFQAALRSAKYRRSPLGREYSLSQHSQQKILRNLRAIMYRLGPTTDPKRPAAQLLDGAPYLTLSKVRSRPKPIFSLDVAAQLVTATHQGIIATRPCAVRQASRWSRQVRVGCALTESIAWCVVGCFIMGVFLP